MPTSVEHPRLRSGQIFYLPASAIRLRHPPTGGGGWQRRMPPWS